MRTPIIAAALAALAACNSPLERQAPMADSVAVAERAGFAQTARVDRVARAAAPLVAQQRAVAAASDVPLFSRSSVAPSMVIRTGQASIEVDSLERAVAQVRLLAARDV